mmetsp:Transcript_70777/g.182518  ORF Transcript_70777/g.182518 Transcript_70777/m.182518 type:complete len:418 (+) Transcript_70777:1077-2330(+)
MRRARRVRGLHEGHARGSGAAGRRRRALHGVPPLRRRAGAAWRGQRERGARRPQLLRLPHGLRDLADPGGQHQGWAGPERATDAPGAGPAQRGRLLPDEHACRGRDAGQAVALQAAAVAAEGRGEHACRQGHAEQVPQAAPGQAATGRGGGAEGGRHAGGHGRRHGLPGRRDAQQAGAAFRHVGRAILLLGLRGWRHRRLRHRWPPHDAGRHGAQRAGGARDPGGRIQRLADGVPEPHQLGLRLPYAEAVALRAAPRRGRDPEAQPGRRLPDGQLRPRGAPAQRPEEGARGPRAGDVARLGLRAAGRAPRRDVRRRHLQAHARLQGAPRLLPHVHPHARHFLPRRVHASGASGAHHPDKQPGRLLPGPRGHYHKALQQRGGGSELQDGQGQVPADGWGRCTARCGDQADQWRAGEPG